MNCDSDKFVLDRENLKPFADDKLNVTFKIEFVFYRVDNIVENRLENIGGKGGNAGYQHFPSFSAMFSKGFILSVIKSWDYLVKLN